MRERTTPTSVECSIKIGAIAVAIVVIVVVIVDDIASTSCCEWYSLSTSLESLKEFIVNSRLSSECPSQLPLASSPRSRFLVCSVLLLWQES